MILKWIEGDKGLFIAMPSKRSADGEYPRYRPSHQPGTREKIQGIILEAYNTALEEPIA